MDVHVPHYVTASYTLKYLPIYSISRLRLYSLSSEVQSVRLSRSSCMMRVESL